MADYCDTITIQVEVQENGIIRDKTGYILGRINDDYSYEDLKKLYTED